MEASRHDNTKKQGFLTAPSRTALIRRAFTGGVETGTKLYPADAAMGEWEIDALQAIQYQ
jgi:hypothetical protein